MSNVLQIGSSIDIQAIKAGMEECARSVKSGAGNMAGDFQALAAESRQSVTEISENWVTAAQASLVLKSAQSEVRAATKAAKEAADGDSAALAKLALAKRQAAAAADVLKQATQAATAGEVEEEGALTVLNERLIESAEAAQLAGSQMAGFAGVASLLGGGLLLGFFAHLEDEIAKNVLELDHLHAQTGINITSLAGLQQVTRSLGVEFEPVSIGLIRMQRAQQQAVEGNKAAVTAFGRLGISVDELKTLNPEALFYRLAEQIRDTSSSAAAAASAIAIFGKGGAALIPVFKDAGTNLADMVHKAGEASGVTEQAAASAREWRADISELSQMLRSLATEALTPLLVIIKGVQLGFEALGVATLTVVQATASALASLVRGIVSAGKITVDLARGNMVGAVADAVAAKGEFTAIWKTAGTEIESYWKKLAADRDKLFAFTQPKQEEEGRDNVPDESQKPGPDSNLEDIKIKAAEAHALAMVEIERKRFEADQKVAEEGHRKDGTLTAAFYTDQERQEMAFVQRELAIKQNAIDKLRELDKQKRPEERDASLAGQSQAAEDQAAKQRVEINARTQEQIIRLHEQGEKAVEQILHQLTEAEQREAGLESQQAKRDLDERERQMRERIRFAEEMADQELTASKKLDDEQLRHHVISATEWERREIAAVEEWAQRKRTLLEQSMAQEVSINGRETVEYERLKNQEVLVDQEAAEKKRQIEEKLYEQTKQIFENTARAEIQDVFNGLNEMIQGHKTAAQAIAETWNSMVTTLIRGIEEWITNWLMQHVVAKAANALFATQTTAQDTAAQTTRLTTHQTANAAILASDTALAASQTAMTTQSAVAAAASDAGRVAANSTANLAIVASDAGAAAAAGFASVMEALPFPENVAVAPGVAAAALAETLAFGSAAAFETGGIVPRTGFVLAHEKEGILPRNLTEMLISSANGGGTRAGAQQRGGGHSFQIAPTFVINGPVSRDELDGHMDYIAAGVRRRLNGLG